VSRLARTLGAVAAAVVLPLLSSSPAGAHPLGNFTVNLYSGITLSPGTVTIDYVLDMAEIPTFQERDRLDADGDGRASASERESWAARVAPSLAAGLSLDVDDRPVPLAVASAEATLGEGQGGLDVLRLEMTIEGTLAGSGRIEFRDGNFADRVGWREITAVGLDGIAVRDATVPARSASDRLLAYPAGLLSSPLAVTEARLSFAPGAATAAQAPFRDPGTARPDVGGGAFVGLVSRPDLSVPFVALALLLAAGLGALHALGPGHGKTIMAAYLVGAGGRGRQALTVGAAVSVMHTASVLAIGLAILAAGRVFPAERVYPWGGLASGLVALSLGAGLLASRLRQRDGSGHRHPHEHEHPDEHRHPERDTHAHAEAAGGAGPLSRKGLAALAISGGLLPSPSALVVLLAAVALHRVAFGVALIAAFSVGLAAALTLIGLVALRARDSIARRLRGRAARLVPILSAGAILGVGALLIVGSAGQL